MHLEIPTTLQNKDQAPHTTVQSSLGMNTALGLQNQITETAKTSKLETEFQNVVNASMRTVREEHAESTIQ
jgi:hypothetical protein